jgi:hypothetical protein
MRFKVYLLREDGRRRAWRAVKNGKTYVGALATHLQLHSGEQDRVLRLLPTDPVSQDLPPELYEPVLLGFAPLAFRVRGFERVQGSNGRHAVVQEWHCEEP